MKNNLEKFVNQHRADFDSDLPGNDVWSSINTDPVPQKGKLVSFFTRMRVAVAVLVVVNALVIVFLLQRKPVSQPSAAVSNTIQPAAAPAQEQALDQISRQVEVKQAALKEIQSSNPVLYKKFMEALEQLSAMYKDLEKEFAGSANKEELLEAMIQNLGLQQELLNQQLSIYQKVKQQKNEKDTKHI